VLFTQCAAAPCLDSEKQIFILICYVQLMNLVRGGRTAAFCGGLRSVNILMQENICDELLKHRTVDQLREHWTFE
jgi:hypothetical protein